ncbi:hypothetical protein [Nesterenkonia pannonica]|nr:hypothetical protein [Nesterenkonia pannonica]
MADGVVVHEHFEASGDGLRVQLGGLRDRLDEGAAGCVDAFGVSDWDSA